MTAPPRSRPDRRVHENGRFAVAMAIALLVLATFLLAIRFTADDPRREHSRSTTPVYAAPVSPVTFTHLLLSDSYSH